MLFGPNYEPPDIILELEHHMFIVVEQSTWLAQLLTDEGNPSWLHSTKKCIAKSSLRFTMKFWWEIVRLRLMSAGEDTNIVLQREVLVASFFERMKIDFGHIIADELFSRSHRTTNTLPFPCLIMELGGKTNVLLLRGVYIEILASH